MEFHEECMGLTIHYTILIYLIYWYWISRGLGVLGFLGYIGFQSQNASFRATCAQKGREEKCWMLWFLLNQWSTGPTGVPEKLKQSETVGSGPAWSCQNCQSAIFLQKKTFRAIPFFFESATGNSWKQLGLVPSSFFADWQFWHDQAGPLPTVSDRFRPFPTVSDCFSFSGTPVGPVDHWFNKNHNIQHFSSRPFCAQVARNDAFWLWNPIKIPKPQDLVKFNIYWLHVFDPIILYIKNMIVFFDWLYWLNVDAMGLIWFNGIVHGIANCSWGFNCIHIQVNIT